jgi:hypothetical protein
MLQIMVGLEKPDGGIRSIAIGEEFSRFAAGELGRRTLIAC